MYGAAFDPRYGSLLVPSVRSHHRLASGSSVPGPSSLPCELGKVESGTGSSWSGAFTGAGAEIGLNVDTGLPAQEKSKDLYWF
ncbi:transcription cofactor vestigial-like protein 2 [Austrofundulus limnaeus]|uniref:Transcription cofactor vestigial-like protein 2 n=1 Tax=Austrofundulus limnaeus TaxID=52670 RepID=A0A2I4D8G4_AUSLI|nr:PREDICTED: transcription cofactor vestigial-like protein 2 [Austrofundulus limnaeus]